MEDQEKPNLDQILESAPGFDWNLKEPAFFMVEMENFYVRNPTDQKDVFHFQPKTMNIQDLLASVKKAVDPIDDCGYVGIEGVEYPVYLKCNAALTESSIKDIISALDKEFSDGD